MRQSGFSTYMYETSIQYAEITGNEVKLYNNKSLYENKGIGHVATVEMSSEQFNEWAQSNQFITFVQDGQAIKYIEQEEDFDWLENLCKN